MFATCQAPFLSGRITFAADLLFRSLSHRAKTALRPSSLLSSGVSFWRIGPSRLEKDMNAPGWRLHPLHGDLEGHWSVDVSGNWRLKFRVQGEDAVLVDYQDYH